MPDKTAESTIMALREFIGDRMARQLYSDRSGEIGKAFNKVKILAGNAQPGVPETNSLIERANQTILDGVRVVLVQAGLPVCFWP